MNLAPVLDETVSLGNALVLGTCVFAATFLLFGCIGYVIAIRQHDVTARRGIAKRTVRILSGILAAFLGWLCWLGFEAVMCDLPLPFGLNDAVAVQDVLRLSPSGRLLAHVYHSELPTTEDNRFVKVQRRLLGFDKGRGDVIMWLPSEPFIDLEWRDENHLVVTCVGDLGEKCEHRSPKTPKTKSHGVSIAYRYFSNPLLSLKSRAVGPGTEGDTVDVIEYRYGDPSQTLTRVAIHSWVSHFDKVINPKFIGYILYSVKGPADVTVEWRGEKELIVHCPKSEARDQYERRQRWSFVRVTYAEDK